MKPRLVDNCEKVNNLTVKRLEIVTDDASPDKVELYVVDHLGERLEGGTFSLDAFMTHCLKFYNDNY